MLIIELPVTDIAAVLWCYITPLYH